MREKLLVCVSALQASAAHWRGGRIVQLEQFANDDRGLAAFREFLTQRSNVPVYMMVDAVEEDYRFEALPHSFGRDRAQMVSRKLRQHYRNTPYVGAWLQGRETEKRRDDRYLFAALTNADIPASWMRIVNAQELPLAALYLLPMVSAGLIDKLQIKASNLLVASLHSGGLRLTFFRDRQFRLSRLTRGDGAKSADLVQFFSGEISNTRLYLHALRTATLDEHLTVLLLDRNDELAGVVEAILTETPSLECRRVGRAELCSKLAIDSSTLSASPDAIYLQLLGLAAPEGNIAPANATLGYRQYRARRAVYASCAAVGALAMLWSGFDAWRAYELRSQAAETAKQITAEDLQYRQLTRQFPAAPTSGENLKRAVDLAKSVREGARDPLAMMAAVSSAIEPSRNVVVREFGWKYGLTEIDKGADTASASAAPTTPGLTAAARRQSAYVAGEIKPFRGDYRAAIDTIEALASRLRDNPAVLEVRATKMPLNVSPKAALSGTTLDVHNESASAEFELLIVFKPRV